MIHSPRPPLGLVLLSVIPSSARPPPGLVVEGINADIKILFTLIKCFHLHREKVRGWTSRYPQDEEISSGLTNCSGLR